MEKIYDAVLDETVVTHTCASGLRVIVLHKRDNINTTAYFAVPFGALTLAQRLMDGALIEHEPGLAHFLEHKLFENHQGMDVMERFSALSCNVNAFTSYTETVYYFNTAKADVKAPLTLLMDFVQSLNITDESVEKEKKIIIQELRMYHQMPEARLMYETYRALYHHIPVKYDIGGSEASVSAMTKAKLEAAYALNYHPANALMVIVSSLDPSSLIEIIAANPIAQPCDPMPAWTLEPMDEPHEVVYARKSIPMEIGATKMTYTFKLPPMPSDPVARHKREWALKLRLELLFSSLNPEYQKWVDRGVIHDYFGYDVEINDHYAFVLFYGETEDEHVFTTLIDTALHQPIDPLLPFLRQLKRRYRSYAFRLLDDQDDYAVHTIRGLFTKISLKDSLRVLEELTAHDLIEVFTLLDHAPHATVSVRPRKEVK
jgi:predicted Zn-dependent peptidase